MFLNSFGKMGKTLPLTFHLENDTQISIGISTEIYFIQLNDEYIYLTFVILGWNFKINILRIFSFLMLYCRELNLCFIYLFMWNSQLNKRLSLGIITLQHKVLTIAALGKESHNFSAVFLQEAIWATSRLLQLWLRMLS